MPDRRQILCFGGPLNEQLVWISPEWGHTFDAPIPERQPYRLAPSGQPWDAFGPSFRKARYDVRQLGVILDDEPHVWHVGVVTGFPEHRITDQMNAILVMCQFPWAAWLTKRKGTD